MMGVPRKAWADASREERKRVVIEAGVWMVGAGGEEGRVGRGVFWVLGFWEEGWEGKGDSTVGGGTVNWYAGSSGYEGAGWAVRGADFLF